MKFEDSYVNGVKIDFIEHYDRIEDAYIPGDTLPPVKNEWHLRYTEYYYDIQIESQKSLRHVKSYRKPIIRGGFLGIYDQDAAEWKFINVKEANQFRIIKYSVKVRYALVKDDDDGIEVAFKKDKPEALIGDEW